jgi:hypothetical protein
MLADPVSWIDRGAPANFENVGPASQGFRANLISTMTLSVDDVS